MRKLVLAVVVVALAVGASVGVVLGSGSTASIKASANFHAIQMHRVNAPGGAVRRAGTRRHTHRARVIYLESDPFTLAAGATDGGTGSCPRRSRAINGYYGEDGHSVFPVYNAVGNSLHKWTIAVHNMTAGPDASVFVGTVCLKP
jgi:hypothetical protein